MNTPSPEGVFCSFSLMKKNQKIKAAEKSLKMVSLA